MKKSNVKSSFYSNLTDSLSKKNNFSDKFLKLFLYPLIITLLAVIVFIIFGFNKSFELKPQKQVDIQFMQTVESNEFNDIVDEFSKLLDKNGFNNYQFSKLNENNIKAELEVKLLAEETESVNLETFKIQIENLINNNLGYSDAIVSDFVNVKTDVNNFALGISLSIIIFAVLSFIYALIRIELVSAFAIFINIIYSSILLFSSIALFRIPISTTIVIPMIIQLLATTLLSFFLFTKIKNLQYDSNSKVNLNRDLVSNVIEKYYSNFFGWFAILIIAAIVLFIPFIIIGKSVAFSLLATVIAGVVSFYTTIYIGTSIWIKLYKRSKNKRIEYYRNSQAKKQEKLQKNNKTDDEKLIV